MTAPFRSDIEIARGVAILFVFLFHLLPSMVPAGFLGVDIFFVLSGYLMSSVYRPSAPGDTTTYLLRRARRILPAYFTVLVGIVMASAVIVLPNDLHDVVRHALFSAFLIPNIGFWLDGSYFDKSIFRPALHFWSLGVEIQFYLIVPLLVLMLRRWPRLLIVIGVASFLACLAMLEVRPRYAFYLTPFRLWEFLLGYCVQRFVSSGEKPAAWQWGSVALLAAIAAAMFVPISEASHPKYQALFVSAATAAILVTGLPSPVVSSLFGRLMAEGGKYSYSIYLIHYPVVVLWFYEPFVSSRPIHAGIVDVAVITTATLALSLLLFHAVEAPFRRLSSARSLLRVNGGLFAAALATIALVGPLQRAMTNKDLLLITDGWLDRGAERCGRLMMMLNTLSPTCAISEAADNGPRFLLVGDSHADSLKDAMAEVALEHRVGLRLLRENCTVGTAGCTAEKVADIASAERISTVIVHSLGDSLRPRDIEALAALGCARGFKVVAVDPVPVWRDSIPRALHDEWKGRGRPAWLNQTLDDYRRNNAKLLSEWKDTSGVARFSPAEILCRPDCVYKSSGGKPYYFDQGHLTITGARELRPIFERIFRAPATPGTDEAARICRARNV